MSDPVGLAGTIGTWVAVFIAVVALAGILPAYLLYKKSRTEIVQALALVDDPTHSFISGGIRLPGIRLNQKIKVPDFVNPPRLQSLVSQPDPGRLGLHRSTTDWVNFAHVMMAIFPSIKMIPGSSLLAFGSYQTHLPVHRSWIVLLGVLHRYAFRPDYGLPLGASPDASMEARDSKNCLSGLSGMLFRGSMGDEIHSLGYNPSSVFYEMHTVSQLQQCLRQETINIRVLVLLFLGYIQMPNGEYFIAHIPIPSRSYVEPRGPRSRTTFASRLGIMKITNGEVVREHALLFRELDLSIPTVKYLKLVHPSEVLGRALPPNLDAKIMEEKGFFDVGLWKPSPREKSSYVWMARKDIHLIISWFFCIQLSPQGILYETASNIVVQRAFKAEDLPKTLELAKRWSSKLDVSDEGRRTIQVALDAVTESDTAGVPWSRHAMQTFYALDEAIQLIWKTCKWKYTSISILYAIDEVFRTNVRTGLENIEDEQYQTIEFDITNKCIRVPDREHLPQTHDFDFDFELTFPGINLIDGELSISFASVVFASLQGHLRATMWRMSLNPKGLFDFYQRLGTTCYVGTHSIITTIRPESARSTESAVSADSERSADESPSDRGSIESRHFYRPQRHRWAEDQDASVSVPRWDFHTAPPVNIEVPQGGAAYPMTDFPPRFPASQPASYPLPPYAAYPPPGWYPQYPVPGWYPAPPPAAPPPDQRPGEFGVELDSRNDNRVYNPNPFSSAVGRRRSIG